jgi:hypothetical protein
LSKKKEGETWASVTTTTAMTSRAVRRWRVKPAMTGSYSPSVQLNPQPVTFYSPINYFSMALMSSLRSVASFLSKKKEGQTPHCTPVPQHLQQISIILRLYFVPDSPQDALPRSSAWQPY